ncbi:hypothetical protein DL95DRAFT_477220 [Leptodontidium sp. 2 PMI_412]|nr:hypothetical protein DL95DRAFT_477220 [Leptodontidium sp. 2 PMI_412]
MGNTFSQFYFVPAPTLTEKNCPDLAGKAFQNLSFDIPDSGYGGVGFELCKILYEHNAIVYMAGRSESKGQMSIEKLHELYPQSKGRVEFLYLDLSDLLTLKPAVIKFLSNEQRLDVLTLNAGVMNTPAGSQTAQGHEMQFGTNCLGSHLLYLLLRPTLLESTKTSAPGSVRVTWAGSIAIDVGNLYAASKTGNLFLAAVNGRKDAPGRILHLCWNPGNLRTDLIRHNSKMQNLALELVMNPPVMGAYTELFAAVGKIPLAKTGSYVAPWGRLLDVRKDVQAGCMPESQGGLGSADKFVIWCDKMVAQYL